MDNRNPVSKIASGPLLVKSGCPGVTKRASRPIPSCFLFRVCVARLDPEARFSLSIDGPLFGSTVSERADRHSVRTSPQVARRESIAPDGFTCGRSPLGRRA